MINQKADNLITALDFLCTPLIPIKKIRFNIVLPKLKVGDSGCRPRICKGYEQKRYMCGYNEFMNA